MHVHICVWGGHVHACALYGGYSSCVLRQDLFTFTWNLLMDQGWLVSKPQGSPQSPSPQLSDHQLTPLSLAFVCPSDRTMSWCLYGNTLTTELGPYSRDKLPRLALILLCSPDRPWYNPPTSASRVAMPPGLASYFKQGQKPEGFILVL